MMVVCKQNSNLSNVGKTKSRLIKWSVRLSSIHPASGLNITITCRAAALAYSYVYSAPPTIPTAVLNTHRGGIFNTINVASRPTNCIKCGLWDIHNTYVVIAAE